MFVSRRRAITAAAVVAAQLVALPVATVAAGPAAAAPTSDAVSCQSTADVLAVDQGGTLFSYHLSNPSTADATFVGPVGVQKDRIGSGWQGFGKVLAGPDGWIYAFKPSGVLLYHHDQNGWDVLARPLGTTLAEYASASRSARITVDERGSLFVLDAAGAVRRYQLNGGRTGWAVAGDLVLAADATRNLVVAAGDGVLYTRSTSGVLYRTRYEVSSDRLVGDTKRVGGGWQGFPRITSAGGDVLLATNAKGELLQYRFREDTATWPVAAHRIGTGFGALLQVSAVPNACRLTVSYVPPAVTVTGDLTDAPGVNVKGALVDVFAQSSNRQLAWRRLDPSHEGTSSAWITTTVQQIGTPAASALDDDRATMMTTTTSGRMYAMVQGPGTQTMQTATDEGGLMASTPAAFSLRDRTTGRTAGVVYAAVDAGGTLWTKLQNGSTGEFSPWTSTGVTGLSSSPVAMSQAVTPDDRGAVLVVARTKTGSLAFGVFDGQRMVRWESLGGEHLVGAPAVANLPVGFVAVASRDDAGHYQYRWLDRYTNPDATGGWTQLPDADLVGRPAVLVDGRADAIVVARKSTGGLALTRRPWNVDGPMAPWSDVPQSEPGTGVSDPAVATGFNYLNGRAQWLMLRGGTRPGWPTIVLVQDAVLAPQ